MFDQYDIANQMHLLSWDGLITENTVKSHKFEVLGIISSSNYREVEVKNIPHPQNDY